MSSPARVAVLASGGGSNLQALLDRFNHRGSTVARVELVIASRPLIGALQRAERFAVPSTVLPPGDLGAERFAAELLSLLDHHSIDIVVLAGYLSLVPDRVVARYSGRMINIHPALLPGFGGKGLYGDRVHTAVLAAGVTVTGATVHLVDEVYDRGRILGQWPVPVLEGDTVASLAARVLRVEHLLLPQVVEALAVGAMPRAAPGAEHFALSAASSPDPDQIASLIRVPVPSSAPAS
jgi:phosphoribosylglycinamide formyltransferase 1